MVKIYCLDLTFLTMARPQAMCIERIETALKYHTLLWPIISPEKEPAWACALASPMQDRNDETV